MLMSGDYQAIKEPDALNLGAIAQMRGNDIQHGIPKPQFEQ